MHKTGHGRRDLQLYWLQKQHTAGDNSFDPYILYGKEPTDHVIESHRLEFHQATESRQIKHHREANKDMMMEMSLPRRFPRFSVQLLTTVAVVFGVLAFVAQVQGLRFSNWSCSVAQLIALAAATFLRAVVRRSMTKTPGAVPVDNDYILDHLAVAMISHGSQGFKSSISGAFHPRGSFLHLASPPFLTYAPFRKGLVQRHSPQSGRRGQKRPAAGRIGRNKPWTFALD